MRFAALVALVVVASTVPGLAAPAGNSHPQVTSKRDDSIAEGVHFKKSPGEVIDGPLSLVDLVSRRTNSNNTKSQSDFIHDIVGPTHFKRRVESPVTTTILF